MKSLYLAAVGAAILGAAPAAAADADRGFYAGIEGGALFVRDIHAEAESDFFGPPDILSALAVPSGDRIDASFKTGFDVDLIAGYDWGWVRTELELGYKRAAFDEVAVSEDLFFGGEHDSDGSIRLPSIALNLLADIPLGGGWNVYAGPGIGYAWIYAHPKVDLNGGSTSKLDDERESGMLLQGIAGVRKAITDSIDVGLKYRYIRSNREKFDSGFYGDVEGRFVSHSVLASLIFNLGRPSPAPVMAPVPVAEPVPPPPPPPATQTCPDGSVVLATDACPPPPPPPPPAPEPERG